MAKQPELETLTADYTNKTRMNKNFENIVKAFRNALFRSDTGNEPNAMNTDYNVGDANVTNVRSLVVNSISVGNTAFTGFGEQYVHKLGSLTCSSGHMLSHDANGDPRCLPLGEEGQVLGTDGTDNAWLEDIDTNTDTDTIGITIQEDGVTVAENVTNIDFLWTGSQPLATTPASDQVDLALTELLFDIWEDTNQADSNLDPDNDPAFDDVAQTTRVDLFDIGIREAETGLPTTNAYYVGAEGSNNFELSGAVPAPGTWAITVAFFEDDGTDTPQSGTKIGINQANTGSTAGGNLVTLFEGIPAGTRYVDFYWSLLAVSPLSLQVADFSDRYRCVIKASDFGTHETPTGKTATGTAASTTP